MPSLITYEGEIVMGSKIEELAPTLAQAGVSVVDIVKACRPTKPAEPVVSPIPAKRYREAMELIATTELSDTQIAQKVAGFSNASQIALLRAEVAAVKAALSNRVAVEASAPVALEEPASEVEDYSPVAKVR